MRLRTSIILYGVAMAGLIALLKFVEYSYFVRDLSLEIYIGVVALVFVGLGIWVGRRLTSRPALPDPPPAAPVFPPDEATLKKSGVTKREFEVLGLIAEGLSNQEIADRLFVSTSTVKTHTSNLFLKLDASRRTQAIQKAKELGLLP
ncbi:MAG: DNA-binding response regulator [Chloracidobacterium sp.]|nr:DNA-binding response regulator [Chloracidobacterium sp.]